MKRGRSSPKSPKENDENIVQMILEGKDKHKPVIVEFLMNVPPSRLSQFCSLNKRVAEICGSSEFVERYSNKHGNEIAKRQKALSSGESRREYERRKAAYIASWHQRYPGRWWSELSQDPPYPKFSDKDWPDHIGESPKSSGSEDMEIESSNESSGENEEENEDQNSGAEDMEIESSSDNEDQGWDVMGEVDGNEQESSSENESSSEIVQAKPVVKNTKNILEESLIEAVINHNLPFVKKWANPKTWRSKESFLKLLISQAVAEDDDKILDYLISSHPGKLASIKPYNAKNKRQYTNILTAALELDSFKAAEVIIKSGEIDPSENGNEALRESVEEGVNFDILVLLLNDPRVVSALQKDDKDKERIFEWLASRGFPNRQKGSGKILSLLLEKDLSPGGNSFNKGLVHACTKDNEELVKIFLADGRADPTANNNKAVRKAVGNGSLKCFKLLLKDERVSAGIENVDFDEAFQDAVFQGYLIMITSFLEDPRVKKITKEALDLAKTEALEQKEAYAGEEFGKRYIKIIELIEKELKQRD